MSCPKTMIISAYLDEELQGTERAAFETHMRGCVRCGTAFEGMRALHLDFTAADRHGAPFGFAARVMARTAELERKRSPWSVPLFIRFAEAAVLLMVITVGILAGRVMMNSSLSAKTANIASSFSLDLFDAAPPGSLGNAYLAMTEVRNEK